MNVWLMENATEGVLGQFAKREEHVKRWPVDEAQREQMRVANGTKPLLGLIDLLQSSFNKTLEQVLYAVWPNPFLNSTPAMENVENLFLVDGSEVLQEIPLWPIIQPARRLDFIIANDAGGTELSNGWMNGTSLLDTATYAAKNKVPFPKVPDEATFLNNNMTLFPTFFGCYEPVEVPLVLYVADAPWSAYTNETFLDSIYNRTQLDTIFKNSLDLYSYGSNTIDPEWSGCIACGFILRSLQRMGVEVPEFCNGCWDRHCWNGKYNSTLPNDFFEPSLVLNPKLTYTEFENESVDVDTGTSSPGSPEPRSWSAPALSDSHGPY